jgi:hypothetical protein
MMEARLRRLAMHKMIPIVVLLALIAKRSDSQRQARPTRRRYQPSGKRFAKREDKREPIDRSKNGTETKRRRSSRSTGSHRASRQVEHAHRAIGIVPATDPTSSPQQAASPSQPTDDQLDVVQVAFPIPTVQVP